MNNLPPRPTTIVSHLTEVYSVENPSHKLMIRAADFDAKIHLLPADVPVAPAAVKAPKPAVAPRPKLASSEVDPKTFGTENEDALKLMTHKALMGLPEVAFIDLPAPRKDDLVAQILTVRAAALLKE